MPVVELSGCAPPAVSRYGDAMDTPTPPITIWHNPACSTSRNALAAIREAGIEPRIVKYLETTPSRGSLETVAAALGGARRLLRAKEPLCRELGLDDPSVDEARLIDAMRAHPVLIDRPVVIAPGGTRLCRPAETVRALLPGA